ncbi:MAG: 4Fe-4S dicluster domain-containing protein [Candidatus Bathyarchaeota archaeon]|nr:MAG: 4Fe-4S dicluster domain-containing protein [Candidatus Bathyarchaeota archaeon]
MTKKTIRDSELDPNFKFEIAKTYEGKSVLWCVQCGMCTSNCPYSDVLDVKPHQLIKMILLGMREQAISNESIWLCSTCFMCAERCPQGVELGRVLFALKNLAAKEKDIPEGFRLFGQQLIETGRATEITGSRKKERERLGLPQTLTDSEDIRSLLKKLKLNKLLKDKGGQQK